MKNKKLIIIITVIAAMLILAAIIFIPMLNKSSDPTPDTAYATDSSAPWLVSYFAEMRGIYAKVDSDNPSEEEQAYNTLIDELNTLLDEYQAAADKGLSSEAQNTYEIKVQAKLAEIEAAYKQLDSPPPDRDSLLEQVYELEAEIREANPDGTSSVLSELETKTTELKSELLKSQIDIEKAIELYQEYSKEFEELNSPDQD